MAHKISWSMKFSTTILLLTGITLGFSSCSSDEDGAGANISPKEAVINYASNEDCQMVMSMRLGDLINKSGLMSDLLPSELKMMADGYINQFLDKKENGLNIDETAYIIGDFTGLPKAPKFIGVVLAIDNAETFAAFVEAQTRMQPESGDGYSYISLGSNGVIAWNSGMAAVFSGESFMGGGASKELENTMKAMSEKGKGKTKELAKFTDKKSDFGFYMDFEKYMKVVPATDELSASMLNSPMMMGMMKDAYFTGYINFEKGKITTDYEMNGNADFMKLMKTFYGNGNPEFANYLGGEDLIGFGTMSVNIDVILDYYEKTGFFETPQIAEGLAAIKAATGLSIRDIANKFSGDFSIGFAGIEEDNSDADMPAQDEYAGYSESGKNTKPIITLAIGIRDSLLSKIMDTIPALTKKANYYSFSEMGGMTVKKGVLFITSNQAILEDFALDGRLNSYSKNNAQKMIADNSMYGYFNFEALTKALMEVNPEVAAALGALDYAEFMATKEAKFRGVLYMKDKNTNALKALGKMIIESAGGAGAMF